MGGATERTQEPRLSSTEGASTEPDDDREPVPLARARLVVAPAALLAGSLLGLGSGVLLAQLSAMRPTTGAFLASSLLGALLGVALPTGGCALGVSRANRGRRAEAETRRRAEAGARLHVLLAVLPVALLAGAGLAAPGASAELSGPCSATVLGQDVDALSSRRARDALAVGAEDTVRLRIVAEGPIASWEVFIHYGPVAGPVAAGTASREGNVAEAEIAVANHAWLGSGLYPLTGRVLLADGSVCEGAVLVDVQESPWGTVMGNGALVLAAGAFLALGVATTRAAREGLRAPADTPVPHDL